MRQRTSFISIISTLLLTSLVLAACTNDSDDDASEAETPQAGSTTPTAGSTDSDAGDVTISRLNDSEVGEIDDDGRMTFFVHDAGEVDIDLVDMELVLVEIRPNEGWTHEIEDEDSDEIEIEFEQQDREAELEVEIENGTLVIETEDEWDNAEPGTYQVGDAGEVEFDWDGDRLTLIEVRPADGWDYEIDDEESDEIEIKFTRGSDEAEFEVEVENGQLEVEIETEYHFEIGS